MKNYGFLAILACFSAFAADTADTNLGSNGAVVTRDVYASRAGVDMLRAGGNAVDAVITAGLTLAVTSPGSASIASSGVLLVRRADGRAFFLDFTAKAPRNAGQQLEGVRAAAVPGLLRGLEAARKNHGRKTWAELIRPAAAFASGGFQFVPTALGELVDKATTDRLKQDGEANRILLKSGKQFMIDEKLEQPDLARILDRLAKAGASDFYEGETAREFVKALAAAGGAITLDDLKAVKVVESMPLETGYRTLRVLTAPSLAGGAGLVEILSLQAASGFEKHAADTAPSLHLRAEAMKRAFAARTGVDAAKEGSGGAAAVAADSQGNVAVLLITMGSRFGAARMVNGILLNDELNHPQRFAAPAIVIKDKAPVLALCGLGGPSGMTSASQILANVVDFGNDVEQAVNSPRSHYQGSGAVVMERSYPPNTKQGLEERGYKLTTASAGIGEVEALGIGAAKSSPRFLGGMDGRVAGAPRAY
jgi:gamma-glutamyltranspeptidase/glutathione hydrolase